MGCTRGCVLCLDPGPPCLLPHRPLLPQQGDEEVQQEAGQGGQQGNVKCLQLSTVIYIYQIFTKYLEILSIR